MKFKTVQSMISDWRGCYQQSVLSLIKTVKGEMNKVGLSIIARIAWRLSQGAFAEMILY